VSRHDPTTASEDEAELIVLGFLEDWRDRAVLVAELTQHMLCVGEPLMPTRTLGALLMLVARGEVQRGQGTSYQITERGLARVAAGRTRS
jgi:hypothetical protein